MGSYGEMQSNPFGNAIRFNSLDLTRFALPDPAGLNWNTTDVNSLAAAISELTYEACRRAKQRVVPTENIQNRIDVDWWKRILQRHDDKELWKAVGWDGRVFNSSSREEGPSDADFEQHFKALLNTLLNAVFQSGQYPTESSFCSWHSAVLVAFSFCSWHSAVLVAFSLALLTGL